MLTELVSDYLNYLEFERALSKNTIEAYGHDIFSFLEYISSNFGINDIACVKRTHISTYNRHLASCGISPTSIVRKIASIKGFFRYLCVSEKLKKNPALALSSPKITKKLPRVISMQEIEKLLATHLDVMQKALFELFYATGLRVSELVNLEFKNTDLKAGIIRTMGKGSKERIVPVGTKARTARASRIRFCFLAAFSRYCIISASATMATVTFIRTPTARRPPRSRLYIIFARILSLFTARSASSSVQGIDQTEYVSV